MRFEKILLSFIATLVGLLVAGGIFYAYQSSKKAVAPKISVIPIISQIPNPQENLFLKINSPKDESVVDKKILTISGQTLKDATVVVITNKGQDVFSPTQDGNFSTTVNLVDGENMIEITAMAPNGRDKSVIETVTYSTAQF